MSEEKQEENLEEQKSEPEKTDDKSELEKTDDKSDEIQRRDAQIAHWREKAEKLTKDLEEFKSKEETEKPKTPTQESDLEDWKKKIEFRAKNPDYSDDEFDHIAFVADKKSITLEEAVKSEKEYIDFQRKKVAKENNAPEPSSKQTPPKKSPKDITPEDLKTMTVEEKEDYFRELGIGGPSMKKRSK